MLFWHIQRRDGRLSGGALLPRRTVAQQCADLYVRQQRCHAADQFADAVSMSRQHVFQQDQHLVRLAMCPVHTGDGLHICRPDRTERDLHCWILLSDWQLERNAERMSRRHIQPHARPMAVLTVLADATGLLFSGCTDELFLVQRWNVHAGERDYVAGKLPDLSGWILLPIRISVTTPLRKWAVFEFRSHVVPAVPCRPLLPRQRDNIEQHESCLCVSRRSLLPGRSLGDSNVCRVCVPGGELLSGGSRAVANCLSGRHISPNNWRGGGVGLPVVSSWALLPCEFLRCHRLVQPWICLSCPVMERHLYCLPSSLLSRPVRRREPLRLCALPPRQVLRTRDNHARQLSTGILLRCWG